LFLCFVAESDVYIRKDTFGTITPSSLIVDNFVYFLSNANATVTVDMTFTCSEYFIRQKLKVGEYEFFCFIY